MTTEADCAYAPRRRALKVAVAHLATEIGYGSSEDSALESLTEILQSYLVELGRSTRAFCELSGRTEAMVSDVVMALVEMGLDVESIAMHAKRSNKTVFIPPSQAAPIQVPKILQTSDSLPHPSHIPDHLPPFPDPHSYIKTPTNIEPETEYQMIREKAASHKRDVERALTRFIAKTGDTQLLFPDDDSSFPLIQMKPTNLPYLNALLPKDQDLDSQDQPQYDGLKSKSSGEKSANSSDQGTSNSDVTINNPYLQHAKLPNVNRKSKT